MSARLTFAAGWITRSLGDAVDALNVDITFPGGLVSFSNTGAKGNRSVEIQIEYRKVGTTAWLTPVFTSKTVPDGNVSGNTVTITDNQTVAVRHSFKWDTGERAPYEVRVNRVTADNTNDRIRDDVVWTAVRTFINENPISFPYPVATTALEIKATDQLNNVVDDLNATISSYVSKLYRVYAWAEAVSSNPADLYRHVLQSDANAKKVPDTEIDLSHLEDWHDFCDGKDFEFNMIRDFQSSVWDTISDIASAGRASPNHADGKWSVIYDELQTVPTQHFTPRNSWGFQAEKAFLDQPDAMRVRFANRDIEWQQDERIIYADGKNAGNAEEFVAIDAPGITSPAHIWKFARFSMAQAKGRSERWTFNTDFEYIVANRGDMVLLTHDVLLVGLASGRIKSVITGGSPEMITAVIVDEVLTMEAGTDYGLSIRTVNNNKVTEQIVTNAGDQTTVQFTTPLDMATGVSEGDLFGFGELGSETIEGLLLSIEPFDELSARLTCVPYDSIIYNSDSGVPPSFASNLSPVTGPISFDTSPADGLDGVDGRGVEYVFASSTDGAVITGAANLPDPNWNFDIPGLASGVTRGSQTYYDGTPPDVSQTRPYYIRFRRSVPGTPAVNEDIGNASWTQEAAVRVEGQDGPPGQDGDDAVIGPGSVTTGNIALSATATAYSASSSTGSRLTINNVAGGSGYRQLVVAQCFAPPSHSFPGNFEFVIDNGFGGNIVRRVPVVDNVDNYFVTYSGSIPSTRTITCRFRNRITGAQHNFTSAGISLLILVAKR